MTLKHLEIFRTVCREHSMTKAAELLHMTQPAVSRAVAELEEYYNKKLFDRIGRRLLLTADGQAFLADTEEVLRSFETLEINAGKRKAQNTLHIGCSMGIGFGLMPAYLECFRQECPDTRVLVTENATSVLKQYLVAGELDFAIAEGFITEDCFTKDSFFEDELLLLASPGHPLADGHTVNFDELKSQDFLLPDRMTATRELFDHVMAAHGINITPVWTGINIDVLVRMAKAGAGVTVLSRKWVEKELEEGSLKVIPAEIRMPRAYSFVWHRHKYLSDEALRFMAICRRLTK